jgi:hypothetical protein
MEVSAVTYYGWRDGLQTVEKKTTYDYAKGNDVVVVERRSYEVTLYSSTGQLETSSSKGNSIDQMI